MKAVMCRKFGPPEMLALEEVPDPVPRPAQVLVAVHACGINFPDVLIVQDKYQFKPALPYCPGAEFAGVVQAVGAEVRDFAPGDRVCGWSSSGALAEFALTDADALVPVPDGLDLKIASAFMTTYGTGLYALRMRAALQPGQSLLVLGAGGGVGTAAVEIGKALGARVVAAASSDDKLQAARALGADATIRYPAGPLDRDAQRRLADEFKAAGGSAGFDVIYDPCGGDYAEPALRAIAWEGRYLVIGFTAGDIPRIPLNLPLLKGCQIVGVFYGAWQARTPGAKGMISTELMRMIEAGALRPRVTAAYPLARASQALRELMERRAVGKVVVVTDRYRG
ncbi:MAG: NADPH:quinone oxidoreductase family protein [Gammaproteobacteria bacterium]